MTSHWLNIIKAVNPAKQFSLNCALSAYRDTNSVIWYPSAGFDVAPFFLEPIFNRPSPHTSYSHGKRTTPFIDSGIKPFPREIYDITSKEPLLYVFSDDNVHLFHETGAFLRMYKAYENGELVRLKDYHTYNGTAIQLDYYPWILTEMIPFQFWGYEFNIRDILGGGGHAGTKESFDDYERGWNPEWHGFYMQVVQKDEQTKHTYNVLYFCMDNGHLFNDFLSENGLHPKIVVSVDEQGNLYDLLNHVAASRPQLMPLYIVGNREVIYYDSEGYGSDLKFKTNKIYSMGERFHSRGPKGLSYCAYELQAIQKVSLF